MGFEPTTSTLARLRSTGEEALEGNELRPPGDGASHMLPTEDSESPPHDPQLQSIMTAWPTLSRPIRAAIIAMVETASTPEEDQS